MRELGTSPGRLLEACRGEIVIRQAVCHDTPVATLTALNGRIPEAEP